MTELRAADSPAPPISAPAPPPAGGRVRVRARWDAARRALATTCLESARPAAERLLAGRAPADALRLVPLLYSLCGKAQSAVAQAALAAAESGAPGRIDGAAVRREAIAEHLWRLLVDWPLLLGASPERAEFARWHRRLAAGEPDAGARAELADLVHGPLAARVDGLAAGCGEAGTARPPTLPVLAPDALAEAFATVDEAFARRPHWHGRAVETGAMARRPDAAGDLGGRLRARLDDLAARVAELAAPAAPVVGTPLPGGGGIAGCDTARGLLFHRVRLEAGRVHAYLVVAPTEWNFHPGAAWWQRLDGLPAESREIAENALRRWVLALDPCVPATIEITTEP